MKSVQNSDGGWGEQ
nr:hypothetical protein [Candidatus Kuenenia stuttgartiensis]